MAVEGLNALPAVVTLTDFFIVGNAFVKVVDAIVHGADVKEIVAKLTKDPAKKNWIKQLNRYCLKNKLLLN